MFEKWSLKGWIQHTPFSSLYDFGLIINSYIQFFYYLLPFDTDLSITPWSHQDIFGGVYVNTLIMDNDPDALRESPN